VSGEGHENGCILIVGCLVVHVFIRFRQWVIAPWSIVWSPVISPVQVGWGYVEEDVKTRAPYILVTPWKRKGNGMTGTESSAPSNDLTGEMECR
jgi:hypothetical protein